MMRTVFCALLLVNISGCAESNNGIKDVDCTGIYTSYGPANKKSEFIVKVNKIRIDHNGRITIRPKNSLDLRFFPGFKEREILTNYQCKGEDYGLRSPAI